MTKEQAEAYYNAEQRKYYECCTNINIYQNRINELRCDRQKACICMEDKQNELKQNQSLYTAIDGSTKNKDGLFSQLTKINGKIQEAANNFSTMVSSNTVVAFNLTNAFGENATKANQKLNEIYSEIKSGQEKITQVVNELSTEVKKLNSQIEEIDIQISSARNKIEQCESGKRSALANMAYYERIMRQG